MESFIFNALRDLVPLVQFKKRGKYPWRMGLLVKLLDITSRAFISTSVAVVSLHI